MKGKRLLHTIRLCLITSATQRAAYLRKHNVFNEMGVNCIFMDRKVPLYPKLIKIGNNVHFSSNVTLVTHDIVHIMLYRAKIGYGRNVAHIGCIEIGNNVYIGTNTTILYDVKIGNNVIIGAGSVVTKDIPDNSVVAGVPARLISTFEDYLSKSQKRNYPNVRKVKEMISSDDSKIVWDKFYSDRQ